MKKTHNQMRIGKLTFRPFNRLQLEEVFVEDQKGDTLLYAGNVSASFALFRLLKDELLIQSVELDDFVVKVNKESPSSDFNFQFIVDAFRSDKQDTIPSKMNVQIADVSFNKGRLFYDVFSEAPTDEGVFDANHIHIFDFRAVAGLKSIDLEKLNTVLKKLSFTEQSGLSINRLEAKLSSKDKKISLENFLLRLPHSELNIPEAWIDYTGSDFSELLEKGLYSLRLDDNHIMPADLKMFWPPLARLQEDVTFTASGSGTFPNLNLSSFNLNCGEDIRLNFSASMGDYARWKETPVRLDLEHFSANAQGIKQLLNVISPEKGVHPAINSGTVALSARLKGSLPDLQLQLQAETGSGSLHLNGSGGYDYAAEITRFDALLDAVGLDLQTLLQDSLYGYADFQLKAKGSIGKTGKNRAEVTAAVTRFDFNRYSYHGIQADATYSGDSIRLKIDSEDANIPLKIRGMTCLNKTEQNMKLYAGLESVCLDSLHLLPNYEDAYLTSVIRLDVNGLDKEKMNLNLAVDSLWLTTDKGSFKESKFRLNYRAADAGQKELTVSSHLINARASGKFTYSNITESLEETFPVLFPQTKPNRKKKEVFSDNLNLRLSVNHARSLADILELPREMPDSALFIGQYSNNGKELSLSASAYTRLEEDTLQLSVMLSNIENRLSFIFNVDNKSNKYDLDGSIDAEVEFVPRKGSPVPDMNISFNPTIFVLNGTHFDFRQSEMEVREGRYLVHDMLFDYNTTEYIKVNGAVSALPDDSLTITVSQFRLGTIFDAAKTDLPISGEINGEIVAKRLFSKPLILSRGVNLNRLVFAGNAVGDLNVRSVWSSARKGLALRATLTHENHPPSNLSGYYRPEQDSLSLTATVRDLELQWLNEMTKGTLYGLDGSLNADVTITGKLQNPQIKGIAYFDKAQIGITKLNALYSINDSIYLSPDLIELNRFTIKDTDNHTLRLNGKITHRQFADFNPNLSVSIANFLVINNKQQTDSLFYGTLRVNGLLSVKKKNNDWVLSGNVTHSNDSKVMVNVPSSAGTAERYNSVTFINTEKVIADASKKKKAKNQANALSVPLKINVALWIDPSLMVGAVFNPATGDAATVKGNGLMNFAYDMTGSTINLTGDYEVESGKVTLSLPGLTKKTFMVQEGGKLTFNGKPTATTFNLTALYNLRADLTTLDPSFGDMGLGSAKVPVTCALTAIGNIDKMELKYNILFPGEQEEIQRKIDGLLYTDDLKIREIAYLLAAGTFMPINSDNSSSSNSVWTSLASSSITNQLSNLLSGVLNENWSIGTNLRTKDAGFSDVNMDVNISTRLFKDRLTVNSTLGYHSDPNAADNFTGDFDLQYKLNPSGNVLLKVYNTTNNRYYEKAKTTQGVGLVYKREARTFKQLFDKFRRKRKQNEAEE